MSMSATRKRPPKVLHVIGSLNRGGVETWLMNIARTTTREQMPMEICLLTRSSDPGAYAAEFESLGGVIHRCPLSKNLLDFGKRFRRLLREGEFDIVHSHVHHFSGYILRLAAQEKVRGRLAHSHSDLRSSRPGILRQAYLQWMKKLIAWHATAGLACSAEGAESLYGSAWESDPRWKILHCGIDLRPFERHVDRTAVRAEFGFAPDDLVWGHVGSFRPVKNHRFLLKVFAAARAREPRVRLLLIGDGPLRPEMERYVQELGIADAVVFAGTRSDVPRLMLGAMDVFIFPSHYEGLGLVLVEAQVANLPCVVSTAVPREASVVHELVQRLPLDATPDLWADSALSSVQEKRIGNGYHQVKQSSFNLVRCIADLRRFYLICQGSPQREQC